MFKFNFSNYKINSRDTDSYPITLDEVKAKSFYYIDNPDDETFDDFIENVLIPSVINDWENDTKYLLLDQTIKCFVPDLQFINSTKLEIAFSFLNIYDYNNLQYYPSNWDESATKTAFDLDEDILVSDELQNIPSKIRFKVDLIPTFLYPVSNNLEIELNGGFEDNDFTDLDSEIKNCLIMQVAAAIDVKNGYCEDYYGYLISQIYAKFSIEKESIVII